MKQNREPPKERRSFRVRSALQDNVLSLVSILSVILGTLLVVFLMLWFLYRADILSTPLTDLFGKQEEETASPFVEPSLIDLLKEAADDGADDPASPAVRFSGSFDTLRALLAGAVPAASYYMEAETVLHSEKGKAVPYTVQIRKQDSAFRVVRFPTGNPGAGEEYRSDGTSVLYTDAAGRTAVYPASENFFMEALAGVPTLRSFTDDHTLVIDAAYYTESGDEVIYYVRFHHPEEQGLHITEEYWISPGSELVLECRIYAGDRFSTTVPLLFSSRLIRFRSLTEEEAAALLRPVAEDPQP